MIEEISNKTGVDKRTVSLVADELLYELHRRLVEYRGLNGNYLGEEAHYELNDRGFYHLLGVFDAFSERYNWESGSASEYLLRLGARDRWVNYVEETKQWAWYAGDSSQ